MNVKRCDKCNCDINNSIAKSGSIAYVGFDSLICTRETIQFTSGKTITSNQDLCHMCAFDILVNQYRVKLEKESASQRDDGQPKAEALNREGTSK